jgi:hypothetical protein
MYFLKNARQRQPLAQCSFRNAMEKVLMAGVPLGPTLRRQNSNAKISGTGRKCVKVTTTLTVVTVVNIRSHPRTVKPDVNTS